MSIKEIYEHAQEQENAIELFERTTRFRTLEEVETALQEGIYKNERLDD